MLHCHFLPEDCLLPSSRPPPALQGLQSHSRPPLGLLNLGHFRRGLWAGCLHNQPVSRSDTQFLEGHPPCLADLWISCLGTSQTPGSNLCGL
ncbi:hypothetical protein AMECASPLE_032524 [Ameca splendens]|uniref:Uncharacterized protein n=1 Tax=Ameca splendens TaxID=208324 RepID=A0ABV0ZUC7_9TELE